MVRLMVIHVKLKPNAKKSSIEGFKDGYLHVCIKEEPKEGKANRALIGFLADWLGVAKGCIKLKKGAKSRFKTLIIDCVDEGKIKKKLEAL